MAEPVSVVPPALAPGHLLRRAQQVHTELWATRVEGLTGPQYATLVAIAGWDDVDQRRAGQLASLDKSTAAEVVRRRAVAMPAPCSISAGAEREASSRRIEYGLLRHMACPAAHHGFVIGGVRRLR